METEIRKMNESDLINILEIEKEIFSNPWSEKMFLEEIKKHDAFILEDVTKKNISGYICGWELHDEYHITNLGVAKKFQRKGLASRLTKFLMEKKIKKGFKDFFLEVRKSNISALRFYKKFGFGIIGTRKNYYQKPVEDAIIMHCNSNNFV
ncbi:MAG: ribosomal protein S18-alanine N-acetyltransferase [Candidatus Cloacimonetes bacterium]|nr:ribosomal protein S18-alanine N-acetyltransferase [Candidatus Cloacimonadota bacterium]